MATVTFKSVRVPRAATSCVTPYEEITPTQYVVHLGSTGCCPTSGSATCLRSRDGFDVEAARNGKKPGSAAIYPAANGKATVRYGERVVTFDVKRGKTMRLTSELADQFGHARRLPLLRG